MEVRKVEYTTEQPTKRGVVFGRPEGTTEKAVQIAYEAIGGERRVWLPKEAVECRIITADGKRTAYVIRQAEIDGNVFDPAAVFANDLTPSQPVDAFDIQFVDAVEQGVAEANLRFLVNEQKAEGQPPLTGVQQAAKEAINAIQPTAQPAMGAPPMGAPIVNVVEDLNEDGAMQDETGAGFTADNLVIDEENIATGYNASTPDVGAVTDTIVMDIDSDENDDTKPVYQAGAGGLIKINTDGNDAQTIEDMGIAAGVLMGGRDKHAVSWRFTPQKVPSYIMMQKDEMSAPEPVMVTNANGTPQAYHIMNPTLANDSQPAGACLGTVSDSYHLLPHTTVFDPIIKYADQNGLKTHVTSFNQGAKARLDLDVTFATQSRTKAAQRLKDKGHSYLDTSTHGAMIDKLDGLYKYGFAIHNSVDGSGALSVQGQALRVYCTNLATMGGIDTILRLRHKNGVMAHIDWESFGEQIVDATMDLQQWLVNQEMLAHLPLDAQMFDKLIVAASKINICSLPSVKVEDADTQNPKVSLQRGYLWRVISSGFVNPHTGQSGRDLPYVKVAHDQQGTAYHALQCFTGAITHKPEWQSADGKQKMAGNILSIDGTTKKLNQVNSLFTGLGESAFAAYLEHTGKTTIGAEDMDDVSAFIAENPHVMKISIGGRAVSLSEQRTIEEELGLVA